MEFISKIKELAEKIESQKEIVKTEEATKTSFIMPFLNILGYDVFNANEIEPEYVADVFKKGEKVDYAIKMDNKLVIIIECKHWKENLDNHDSQLHRYFQAVDAKFGILTNGIEYRFYTDLDKSSKMDVIPFLEFNFTKYNENEIKELMKFQKSSFDIDKITNNASILKHTNIIKESLLLQLESPDKDFIKFFAKNLAIKKLTENTINYFKPIVKNAFASIVKEIVNDRLHSALKKEEEQIDTEPKPEILIETTEEEIEGYLLVKLIARSVVEPEKIIYKDNQSYMAIFLEKQTQPIVRLHFNRTQKYFGVVNASKTENKHAIEKIDDIFNYADELTEAIKSYISNDK